MLDYKKIKIICLDNSEQLYLTIDKVYETDAISLIDGAYLLIDDSGKDRLYSAKRFQTLAEWRDKRIDEILED